MKPSIRHRLRRKNVFGKRSVKRGSTGVKICKTFAPALTCTSPQLMLIRCGFTIGFDDLS